MVPTRRDSTASTGTSDISSMNSSSDEGEAERKTILETGSIPGSLLVTGGMPLALTLQHCAHTGLPALTFVQTV